jgi:hypothetical protein
VSSVVLLSQSAAVELRLLLRSENQVLIVQRRRRHAPVRCVDDDDGNARPTGGCQQLNFKWISVLLFCGVPKKVIPGHSAVKVRVQAQWIISLRQNARQNGRPQVCGFFRWQLKR